MKGKSYTVYAVVDPPDRIMGNPGGEDVVVSLWSDRHEAVAVAARLSRRDGWDYVVREFVVDAPDDDE